MSIHNPHDAFFRFIMSNNPIAREFLQNCFPSKIQNPLRLETLKPVSGAFVSPSLQHQYSDALFTVQTRDGELCLLDILLDHNSSPEINVAVHLLEYVAQIWYRHIANHSNDA